MVMSFLALALVTAGALPTRAEMERDAARWMVTQGGACGVAGVVRVAEARAAIPRADGEHLQVPLVLQLVVEGPASAPVSCREVREARYILTQHGWAWDSLSPPLLGGAAASAVTSAHAEAPPAAEPSLSNPASGLLAFGIQAAFATPAALTLLMATVVGPFGMLGWGAVFGAFPLGFLAAAKDDDLVIIGPIVLASGVGLATAFLALSVLAAVTTTVAVTAGAVVNKGVASATGRDVGAWRMVRLVILPVVLVQALVAVGFGILALPSTAALGVVVGALIGVAISAVKDGAVAIPLSVGSEVGLAGAGGLLVLLATSTTAAALLAGALGAAWAVSRASPSVEGE